jgi:plastocyanin domain-containing protein
MTKHTVALGLIALISDLAWLSGANAQPHQHAIPRDIEIVVEGAYKPQRIEVHVGEPVRLRFIRKDHGPCTRDVIFPKLNIKRQLVTDQPVTIELPTLAAGEYEFRCAMNMFKGVLVVTP